MRDSDAVTLHLRFKFRSRFEESVLGWDVLSACEKLREGRKLFEFIDHELSGPESSFDGRIGSTCISGICCYLWEINSRTNGG